MEPNDSGKQQNDVTTKRQKTPRKSLMCGVCHEVYKTPRFLPCFHSFCTQCLQDLASKGDTIQCPACRQCVGVPESGVEEFQVNFYMTEDELEWARHEERTAVCHTHPVDLLEFLCTDCDEAICIRCKITTHEHHTTKGLLEASEACQESLPKSLLAAEEMVNTLQRKVMQAEDNMEEAAIKTDAIKQQINDQHDILVAMAAKWRDAALKDADTLADILQQQLKAEKQQAEHELSSVKQLIQRAKLAQDLHSDVDIVAIEREFRSGHWRMGTDCVTGPPFTKRLGLNYVTGRVTDDAIRCFIGCPVTLTVPNTQITETVTKVFRCGEEGACREVHVICVMDNDIVYAAYGGTAPDYKHEQMIKVRENGEILWQEPANGRVTFQKYKKTEAFFTNCVSDHGLLQLDSKSSTMLVAAFWAGTCTIESAKATSDDRCEETAEYNITTNTPVAFDATPEGRLVVLIEEDDVEKHGGNTHVTAESSLRNHDTSARLVRLYRRGIREPVATYTPPNKITFCPTDVCFCRLDGRHKLLVTDLATDSIHVVSVGEDQCQFDRYLAGGCGDFIQPLALDTDIKGRVWIGCANGWVLCCQPFFDAGQSSDEHSGEVECGEGENGAS